MSSFRDLRCQHCLDTYEFQSSGWGRTPERATETHCATCSGAIKAALKKVPVKYVKSETLTDEVSIHQILKWEQDRKVDCTERRVLFVQRMSAPLYKMSEVGSGEVRTNNAAYAHGGDGFRGRLYRYSYWIDQDNQISEAEVYLQTYKNVETGEEVPRSR